MRCMLPPHLAARGGRRASAPSWSSRPPTRRIGSRSACRAAASTSPTATPSRTRPTWTSSAASTSTRAASSARRWSRASSIAAPRARASCRSPSTASPPEAGMPVSAGEQDRRHARLDRARPRPRHAAARPGGRCAGGRPAARRRRHRAARWSSRPGRASRFRAKRRLPNERCPPPPRRARALPLAEADPLYVAYHDQEWGVPEFDDRALFEKLVLDGFQAGLSWITILRKRENFPPRLRRLRAGEDRALHAAEGRAADAGRRHRAQPHEDRGRGRSPRAPGST